MPRLIVRPRERPAGVLAACLLLGFGAGLAAGFLFTEVFGTAGPLRMGRQLGRRLTRRPASHAAVSAHRRSLSEVRAALATEPALRAEPIEVRTRGHGLELRGWVPDRRARALAFRVARAAAGELEVRNHLLVRGEDDAGRLGADSQKARPLPPENASSA